MYTDGVLEVHDTVTFEANTAVFHGGAVSLPLEIDFQLAILLFFYRFCEARIGFICCGSCRGPVK